MKQFFFSLTMLLLSLLLPGKAIAAGTFYTTISGFEYEIEYYDVPGGYTAQAAILYDGKSSSGYAIIPASITVTNGYYWDGTPFEKLGSFVSSMTLPVRAIGDYAFSNCTSLTGVYIPNSITIIDGHAFENCTMLREMVIPDSVKLIYNHAFYNCHFDKLYWNAINCIRGYSSIGDDLSFRYYYDPFIEHPFENTTIEHIIFGPNFNGTGNCEGIYLGGNFTNGPYKITYNAIHCESMDFLNFDRSSVEQIIIGDSVEILPYGLVSGLPITEFSIPNSVTTISSKAFFNCTELENITIGNAVTTIGSGAFSYCSGLTHVTIPNSVTSIGYEAFRGCTGLTSIVIPNSVTSISYEAFSGCSGLTNVHIGNAVTTIGGYAFYGCSGLTNLHIGNSVTNIGSNAFYGCSGLTDITCLAQTPPTTDSRCFSSDIYNTATLNVPMSSVDAYKNAYTWKRFINITGINDAEQGDVDGDGQVTIADVTALIDLLLSGTGDSNPAADVDGDGVVTISDVARLIDKLF